VHRLRATRVLAFLVALLVLLVSLSAEAKKKKKPAKKHKTPAAKSKGKSKEAAPSPPDVESDEASSDEKPSSTKAEADEEEEKTAKSPAASTEEEEVAAKKPAKPARPPAEPGKEESEAGGAPPALWIGLGGGALFRNLSWTGMGLSPYSLSPGPEVAVWFEAFPAAFATDGFAANIGLFGRFNYGIGASSTLGTQTLTTKYQDFLFGLKVRVPFGAFIPFVAAAYGMQKFSLEPVDASRPNFNYSFMHVGGGARIQPTPSVDVNLGAGFLYVMGVGSGTNELGMLYSGASAVGVDVTASLGFRLTSLLGLRAGVDFRQFGVATNAAAPAPTGATDRNITAWGGLEVVFDAVGGGSGAEEPAPAKKAPARAKKPAPREDDADAASEKGAEAEDE
jgi:hypothetical protein